MGSFDGMDPTLVRDLLAEVQRAAAQMRTIESRIAQVTRTAGLATPATHRPSQVADACETMARDVTGRLALLEKREAAPRTGEQVKDVSANGTPASGKDEDPSPRDTTPKDSTGTDSTPKEPRETPKEPLDDAKEPRDDDRASRTTNPRDTTPPEPEPKKDTTPQEPTPRSETPRDTTPTDLPSRNDHPKSETDQAQRETDRPQGETDQPRREADHGETDQPRRETDRPQSVTDQPRTSADEPKDDERDSRRDRGTEPDRSGQDILDTPKRDHPDDIDQTETGKPQVVEVDGVKVLQIPLDPPTAREVEELLENVDAVQPTDLPSVEPAVDPVEPAQPSDGTAGRTGSPTATGDVPATWANDGSDVVSAEARPPSDAAVKSLADNASRVGPTDMPGVRLPTGEWGRAAIPDGITPDGPAGSVHPGGTTAQAQDPDGQATAGNPDGNAQVPGAVRDGDPQISSRASDGDAPVSDRVSDGHSQMSGRASDGHSQFSGSVAGGATGTTGAGDVARWANDGSDVVSVDAGPPSDAALKTLMDNASSIGPMDMPSVQVPPGEWGKGEWVAEDFGPDGEPGRVEANAPDRPIVPPGS
ncbi:hypothetical protein AB0B45_17525 [Nonomuraea sp. NPDC049152]|uniref:hypothetical protein n=1 Tax=Nonomuraea sp. NPDC049152 TaxID=3154350 RepID=UPI0033D9E79B